MAAPSRPRVPVPLVVVTAVVWVVALVTCAVALYLTRQPTLTPLDLGGG